MRATVSSRSCFGWLYRASPFLAAKNIIILILVLTIWWCPCVESSHRLLEKGISFDQCVLLLAFALLHFVLQGQTCLLFWVSLACLLLHSNLLWWKGDLFFLLVLEGILGLHSVVVVLFAQSCPTPCYSMDCTLLVSSVCGILQARILEWIDIPFYRASSWPREWTGISCIADRFFTNWTTREAPVGFHRTDQLHLLWRQWLGHRLGSLQCWMVCLGNELRLSCCFWDWTQVLHFWLFCWLLELLHFCKGILPTVVDKNEIPKWLSGK